MTISQNEFCTKPYRQFPLRLTAQMADDLEQISAQTRINKTTISRIALQKFITELKLSGANKTLNEVCAI